MSDLPSLPPIDSGPTTSRRDRLVARAERAGCGVLHINNSMQELLALVSIGKALREARTEVLRPDSSRPAGQHDTAQEAEASNSTGSRNATPEAPGAPQSNLLESMLQTSGRVVDSKG
ncbi:MAG: hypothetical protein LBC10_01600 [Deltaproteobacteria bacterium]|jgi:hypothetical protein|nr:hypothetical protein [Deltaproteobacteria bacterium]